MARFGSLGTQYFDNNGEPLIDGFIHFFRSGSSGESDRITTYADIAHKTPNPNPVPLGADGRQPDIFFDGIAKAVLTTKEGVQIVVADPVGETSTLFGSAWVPGRIYNGNEVVLASDGQFYKSTIAGNQNNNPVSSPSAWVLMYSIKWSASMTYAIGANVTDDDGLLYQSLQDNNLNNPPDSSPAYWTHVSGAWLPNFEYSEGQNAVGPDGVLYTSLQNGNVGNDPSTEPTWWAGTSAAAAQSANDAYLAQVAAESARDDAIQAKDDAVLAKTDAETAETNAQIYAAAAQAAAGLPSLVGNGDARLAVKSDESGVEWRRTLTVQTIASATTVTPNSDQYNQINVTALAVNATISDPTGTPKDGQSLIIRIKDNGTFRTLAWGSAYRPVGAALPVGTIPNMTVYVGMKYNNADSVWDVLAVAQEEP